MNERGRDTDAEQRRILELTSLVRRVVAARGADPDSVDDLAQETLVRLIEARPRLDDGPLAAYAVVTARNVVATHLRTEQRRQRHAHRLLDLPGPETPEERALRQEEKEAVAEAVGRLAAGERYALIAHEVMDVETANLATELGSTPGAVAARLARIRAKLRVEYLIALRRVEPPTERCRPVLVALSAADRRRQRQLEAGDHLLTCRFCAALSEPLMARRRPLSGILPLPAIQQLGASLRRALRLRQVQASLVVGATLAAILILHEPPVCPNASRPALVVIDGRREISLLARPGLAPHAGKRIRGCNVNVESVPANEGFWIGSKRQRVWMQLVLRGESSFRVRAGQKVTFTGTLVRHGPEFSKRVGVAASEGEDELRRDGYHLLARKRDIRLA